MTAETRALTPDILMELPPDERFFPGWIDNAYFQAIICLHKGENVPQAAIDHMNEALNPTGDKKLLLMDWINEWNSLDQRAPCDEKILAHYAEMMGKAIAAKDIFTYPDLYEDAFKRDINCLLKTNLPYYSVFFQ